MQVCLGLRAALWDQRHWQSGGKHALVLEELMELKGEQKRKTFGYYQHSFTFASSVILAYKHCR